MRLLLDTHVLLWALQDSDQLSQKARELILDARNQPFYSVAALWEVQIKHASHPDRMLVDAESLGEYCEQAGFEPLPITQRHVMMLDSLSRPEDAPAHHDPFDRIMICQAKADGLVLLTHDSLLPDYGEPCVLCL